MATTQLRLMVVGVIFLSISSLVSQESLYETPISAVDLIRMMIRNEVSPSDLTDEVRWHYRLLKEVDGGQQTREVVETKSGSLDRLIAIEGKPLNDAQERDETERILRLLHSPEEQRKLEQSRRKDAEQWSAFLQMFPDAFLFQYAGESGDAVNLKFTPNPGFSASSREGQILHELAGEIWLDRKQRRLVSINGQLIAEVKFVGGLFGHLEKGGQFAVKRAEIIRGDWEMTEMTVNIRGKALLLKTISLQQKEFHHDFERVPADLSISDAAGLLLKQSLTAARH